MSNSPKIERKTKAIMFTDIAGYTQAMSESEQKALEMLRKKRTIIKTLIDNYDGKYVKEIGDGTLSYFESGYNASTCAKELQKLVKTEDLNVRVGIHIGDIVFDNDDVYGDGVNVASRLESLAPAGGVLISKNVYDELINKDDFDGVSLGLQSLKGVGRLVEVYAIKDEYLVIPKTDDYKATEVEVHKDDEVPSLAIIPFKNKGAEEDVFYAYGISADLIADCSGAGLIRVSGLNDVENIDYSNLKYQDLSKELAVRYISTGTLWKMGNMFQLSIELYDTKEKKVVWSDRWQEKWDNLSSIKNKLSDGLLKALDTTPRINKKLTNNDPEAYEYYLKAKEKYEKLQNKIDIDIVKSLLKKAIKLDDNLIIAKIRLADLYRDEGDFETALDMYHSSLKQSNLTDDKYSIGIIYNEIGTLYGYQNNNIEAIKWFNDSLKMNIELDNKLWMSKAYNNIGIIYFRENEYDQALAYQNMGLEIAKELNDEHAIATCLNNIGTNYSNIMKYSKALEYHLKAYKIAHEIGRKTSMSAYSYNIGNIYFKKINYEKALKYFLISLEIQEGFDDKQEIMACLESISEIYYVTRNYEKALNFYKRSLSIAKEIDDSISIRYIFNNLGILLFEKGDYKNSEEYLKKSLKICLEFDLCLDDSFHSTLSMNLFCKKQGKKYDKNEIKILIKKVNNINYEANFHLYQLLDEKQFLDKAYLQIQKLINNVDKKLEDKFLQYPTPKNIIESYKSLSTMHYDINNLSK